MADSATAEAPTPAATGLAGPGFVILISCTAAIGGFLFGFDSAVINGTIAALAADFGTKALGTGFSVSSVLLGSAVGAWFAGALANRFGRKPVMVAASILFLASAVGCGAARFVDPVLANGSCG